MIIFTKPGCNKCMQLKKVLLEKNIPFEESDDIEVLLAETDIKSFPVMKREDRYIAFGEAFRWALSQEVRK